MIQFNEGSNYGKQLMSCVFIFIVLGWPGFGSIALDYKFTNYNLLASAIIRLMLSAQFVSVPK
jgi:hypothetical protein